MSKFNTSLVKEVKEEEAFNSKQSKLKEKYKNKITLQQKRVRLLI